MEVRKFLPHLNNCRGNENDELDQDRDVAVMPGRQYLGLRRGNKRGNDSSSNLRGVCKCNAGTQPATGQLPWLPPQRPILAARFRRTVAMESDYEPNVNVMERKMMEGARWSALVRRSRTEERNRQASTAGLTGDCP